MISPREFQREKLTDEDVVKMGYNLYSSYDRSLAQVEDLLCMRTSSDKEPSLKDPLKTHQPQPWNVAVTHLDLGEFHQYNLTRYWTSEITSDSGTEKDSNMETVISKRVQEIGCSTLNQQNKVPKAWLDMMDKSNMFPGSGAHCLHKFFGLKDFVVMSTDWGRIDIDMAHRFLKILTEVAFKCQSHLPLFVQCSGSYIGFLECVGFRTFFKAWNVPKIPKPQLNMNDVHAFGWFVLPRDYQYQSPAKVSKLSYYIDIRESCKEHTHGTDLASTTNFEECEDHWYDSNIRVYLNATWSDQLETVVNGCGIDTSLDPLDAPEWSLRATIAEKSEAQLGDCLKRFLGLCSSTQTESSNPKKLTCKRIYKQRKGNYESILRQGLNKSKVRKVLKPTPKHEESLIPVKSLNAIRRFLFCDANLQSPQNGSNPSTTTTVEDEVEDKFYLSYKEPSNFFKSTQSSSLLSRLAICLCIVNKYHGGLEAVNQLWGEFVLELKYCFENNCEIKGLEPVEPKLDYSELLQKLQTLNSCIKEKIARDASASNTDTFSDEDEERYKITNEIKRVKTSGGTRPLFKEDFRKKIKRCGNEVLHWLDSVKPSDLVFGLMPTLIHSAVTTLMEHPVCRLGFLEQLLDQSRNKLISLDQSCHETTQSKKNFLNILEDHIHHLTIIEQKVATGHCLLKKFRQVDPSCLVSHTELQKHVADLLQYREVPIQGDMRPSSTIFGKLVCNLFQINYEQRKKESDTKDKVIGLGPHFKEFNSILDCSATRGLCLRLRFVVLPEVLQLSAAYIDKDDIPCFCWND